MKKVLLLSFVISFFALMTTGLGGCSNNKTVSDSTLIVYSEFHNFENLQHANINNVNAFSGKNSIVLNPETEYGFGVGNIVGNIPSFECITKINVSFKSWMDKNYPEPTYVLSVDDPASGKNILWEGKPVFSGTPSVFGLVEFSWDIPKDLLKPGYSIKVYPWNKSKNTFYIDDLNVQFVQVIPKQ